MDYRKELRNSERKASGNDFEIDYVDPNDAHYILNHIESDLQEIYNKIELIEGLREIDETKVLVKELLKKLY